MSRIIDNDPHYIHRLFDRALTFATATLADFYEEAIDYLDRKYHYKGQPSAHEDYSISEEAAAQISMLNAYTTDVVAQHPIRTTPSGGSEILTADGWQSTGITVL